MVVQPHLIDAHFWKEWDALFSKRDGHPAGSSQSFLDFVGDHQPQAPMLELPPITGDELCEVATASSVGGLDGWSGNWPCACVSLC